MPLEEEVAAYMTELASGRRLAREPWELEEVRHLERIGRPYVVRLEMQKASDRMKAAAERIRASASRRS